MRQQRRVPAGLNDKGAGVDGTGIRATSEAYTVSDDYVVRWNFACSNGKPISFRVRLILSQDDERLTIAENRGPRGSGTARVAVGRKRIDSLQVEAGLTCTFSAVAWPS